MRNLSKTLVLLLIVLGSCKKDIAPADANSIQPLGNLVEVKKELMRQIILIAKNSPEFKKTVETECLKQVRGDYNVALDRVLEINRQSPVIPAANIAAFSSLVQQMKELRPGEMPILFVPVMETRDPRSSMYIYNRASSGPATETAAIKATPVSTATYGNPNNYITMVDRDNEVLPRGTGTSAPKQKINLYPAPPPDDPGDGGGGGGGGGGGCGAPTYYPGYIIDNYGNLTYSTCISESFAWSHDVWVLGYEETVSPGNDVASQYDGGPAPNSTRNEGFSEGGGLVQVPDLGDIEPWVKGKPEFKYFVVNSTGTVMKDHVFGKWSRSHFANSAWVDLRDFIGNWNTSVWGPVTYEHWIEEDGGSTSSYTQSISYTNPGGPTINTSFTIPSRNGDDDLGTANVQFTDNVWFPPYIPSIRTVYTINYMNVQRTHYFQP